MNHWHALIFGMEYPWGKEIQVSENKVSGIAKTFEQFWRWKQVSDTGPMCLLFNIVKAQVKLCRGAAFGNVFLKKLPLNNHWAKFNQTWHEASLGDGDSDMLT